MAEYRFDCRECTNKAYSQRYDAYYCLPAIMGEKTLELHDMGGSKHGDFMTCGRFTAEDRPIAIYETVTIYNAEHPCDEPDWEGDMR